MYVLTFVLGSKVPVSCIPGHSRRLAAGHGAGVYPHPAGGLAGWLPADLAARARRRHSALHTSHRVPSQRR